MNRILFFSIILSLACSANCALASCGSASCPLNNYHSLGAGFLLVGLSHEYIDQDQIYVGSSRSFIGAIPGHHDEVQTVNVRENLSLQYGVFEDFAMSLNVPFIHREHTHIGHEDGASASESWNFSGLGDMSIAAQYVVLPPSEEFRPSLSLSLGVKLPTGSTGFKNPDGEEAEVTIQPGTGSTDVVLGAHFQQTLASVPTVSGEYGALPLIVGLVYQVNGKGTDDYRFGNSLQVHIGTAYQITHSASLLFQANGRFQDFANVGSTGEPTENTGGTWIFLSPGLGLELSTGLSASAYVQLPIYQNVHGIQQAAPFNLSVGVSYAFNIAGAE